MATAAASGGGTRRAARRVRGLAVGARASALVLVLGAPAAADPAAADDRGLRGLEILLRPVVGGPLPDSPVRFVEAGNVPLANDPGALLRGAKPWALGLGGQLAIGYRLRPFISAGVRGGYRWTVGANLPDGSTNLHRTGWDAGFYARFFPLAQIRSITAHADPWIGVGVGYQHDAQSFRRTLTSGDAANVIGDVRVTHHSIAVPAGVGIDLRFTPALAIGPSFEASIQSPVAGCVSTAAKGPAGVTHCSTAPPGRSFLEARPYLAWNAGLDVKLTF